MADCMFDNNHRHTDLKVAPAGDATGTGRGKSCVMMLSWPLRRAFVVFAAAMIVTVGTVLAAAASSGEGGHGDGGAGGHGGQGESAGHDSGSGGRGGDGGGPAGAAAASVAGAIGPSIDADGGNKERGTSSDGVLRPDARPGASKHKARSVLPFKTIEKLALKGNLYAKWRLARMYERSKVFPRNRAKAFKLYNEIFEAYRAEDPSLAHTRFIQDALVSLARYYRNGLPKAGVKKNPARAYSILKHVAPLYGDPRAQFMLGQMMMRGEGTKSIPKLGMRWLRMAARKKYAPAQAELGRLYASKKIPSADRAQGLMWLGLAKVNEQDSKTRQSVVEMYESLLIKANREERDRAEHLTLGWQQRYGSE